MEFFYSSVEVSVRKGIPEGTQPKIFSQIFILIKKNEFVPAVFASLKQANNPVLVTWILTENKLWERVRIHGK